VVPVSARVVPFPARGQALADGAFMARLRSANARGLALVRLTRSATVGGRTREAGELVDLAPDAARELIRSGAAAPAGAVR
jgi:hypothetical protein